MTTTGTIRILCFGDSNTYGYVPGTGGQRYPANIRWPGVLQNLLGSEYEVIEEGLSSRTIDTEDLRPGKEGRRGLPYLPSCLETHKPLNWVLVMLGTNDVKNSCNLPVDTIATQMRHLIEIIRSKVPEARILLINPPSIHEELAQRTYEVFQGSAIKLRGVAKAYGELANELGCVFLDAASVTEVGIDGIHLTESGHRQLAEAAQALIRQAEGKA